MPSQVGPRLTEAAQGLEKARDALLAGSQQAGSQRDWGLARRLVELAERADSLREEIKSLTGTSTPQATQEPPGESEPLRKRCPQCGAQDNWHRARTCLKCGYDFGARKRAGFPRFVVRNGLLVKVALQRDRRNVYEHTVPQDKFDKILARLVAMASAQSEAGEEFTVDDVQTGLDCPKYMTYVVVSLLLQKDLFVRGRKGLYRFSEPEDFPTAVAGLWSRLPRAEQD